MTSIKQVAQARLQSFLREVHKLESVDFPYEDSRQALAYISEVFREHLQSLDDAETSEALLDCAKFALWDSFRYLPLLGFVLRSTNVRNAFELYGPMKRLCAQLLGFKVGLLLSSEWHLSPMTYPPSERLPDYVLIGMPATGSSDPLLIPLAGHELGHHLWSQTGYTDSTSAHQQAATKETLELLVATQPTWSRFFPEEEGSALDERRDFLASLIEEKAMRQAEETFCDFVGLILFGRSYFEAFRMMVAPGFDGRRDSDYPAMITRARNLEVAAAAYDIALIPDYVEHFIDDQGYLGASMPLEMAFEEYVIEAADRVNGALVASLISDVRDIITDSGIELPSDGESRRIGECFGLSVPTIEIRSVGDVINAGWMRYHWINSEGFNGNRERALETLSDLMLKSIEILEVEIKLTAS